MCYEGLHPPAGTMVHYGARLLVSSGDKKVGGDL